MKTELLQSDKDELISTITANITTVVTNAVDQLAEATAKGFEQVHPRIDTIENETINLRFDVKELGSRIDKLDSKMSMNFVKVHQEIFTLKIANDLE